jgi:hypothetical protein
MPSCGMLRIVGTYRFRDHQADKNRRATNNVSTKYQPKDAAKKYNIRGNSICS